VTPSRAALGIDVGGTKTAVGLVDVDSGQMLSVQEIDTRADQGAEQLHQRLRPITGELIAGFGEAPRGVGVAVPEVVTPDGSVLTEVVVPGLKGHLAAAWADLGVTSVAADVRAAATAEARFGQGSSFASFGYVSVGTGISYCFVMGGRPWVGANGAAILLGSGVLVDRGSFDGVIGLEKLEEFACGPALVDHYRAAGGVAESARDVLDRCHEDPAAAEVVTAAGRALGLGLAELVNLLDPEAVVVGGGLGSVDGLYWDSAVTAARSAIWAEVSRDVPLLHAALGPLAGVVGAAVGSKLDD
jgi:glucokinase